MDVRGIGSRRTYRSVFLLVIVLCLVGIASAASNPPSTASPADVPRPAPRENVTVVTESARHGTIMAWRPNGSLLYYNDSHTKYFDVDPVEGTRYTVEYTATDTIHTEGQTCSDPPCALNVIERVNLSTGEVSVIHARYDYTEHAGEWHDHVRVNESHVLIADIIADQVFMVNVDTGIVTWLWEAQSDFPVAEGGPFPRDWAHINDVELLDDGRIMVSMRNQDQVVFLNRTTGVIDEWTLGEEDNYSILYEQHNPDFIPAERGGPAVVVADSENRRIVEYQRQNDSWKRTWVWQDDRLQWPRDADRLPNGNTLIVDTHGERVIEVTPNGSIEWMVELEHPYDAERLGTGPGSTGGESAERRGLASRRDQLVTSEDDSFDPLEPFVDIFIDIIPARFGNAIFYVAPVWVGRQEFFLGVVSVVTGLTWIGFELKWYLPSFAVRSPIVFVGRSGVDHTTSETAAKSQEKPVDSPSDSPSGEEISGDWGREGTTDDSGESIETDDE